MDKEIEETFVRKFITKDKKDRTLYELFSIKKRDNIKHQLFNLLDSKYEILSCDKISDDDFISILEKMVNKKGLSYIISDSVDDGKRIPFELAIKNMINAVGDYIIICQNYVVAKQEVIFGGSTKKVFFREI